MRICEFCDELSGGTNNAFFERYGSGLPDRVIYQTDRFRVLPTLGAITQGHLLLIPYEHRTCLADCSFEELQELKGIRIRIRLVMQEIYGSCIFFEHGIRGAHSGGCGVDHAHLHAVPVAGNGVLELVRKSHDARRIAGFENIKQVVPVGYSYLYFEDCTEQEYASPVRHIPSQYMRKLVAASIGKSEWDWRSTGREPELLATLEHLSGVLETAEPVVRG